MKSHNTVLTELDLSLVEPAFSRRLRQIASRVAHHSFEVAETFSELKDELTEHLLEVGEALRRALNQKKFHYVGYGVELGKPLLLRNPHRISIGDRVKIGPGAFLDISEGDPFMPAFYVGEGVEIGGFLSVAVTGTVDIGRNVRIGHGVRIADHMQLSAGQDGVKGFREFRRGGRIRIGEGAQLGDGCCIMPNVVIGAHAIIGPNAVVSKSVPDRSMVMGNPARIVKQYDKENECWVPVRSRPAPRQERSPVEQISPSALPGRNAAFN